MSIPFFSGTLPVGIFSSLLSLWYTFRISFVNIFSFMTEKYVTGTNYTILSIMVGGGITSWIILTLAKWVTKWF
jgi:hypothetical protein